MTVFVILVAVVLVGFMTIRYGKSSTPVEHGYHHRWL